MQSRTCILSAFTLSTAMAFGVAALAADLPKEGTYRGTYSGVGTAKATPIGKERLLMTWDETGLQLSNGLFDHTTLHCSGLADFTNGLGQGHGNCVSTDPVGDQIVFSVGPEEKHALDQKSWSGPVTFTTGTGKYTGISGGGTYVQHLNEFHALAEGTYVSYTTFEGSYKFP
jgi:hypothetical protein